MMRPPGTKGYANDTAGYGLVSGSFPHYKHVMMPADQKAKLLAMHRASRANAGIYVAVVLGVYLILLTMLLCRYAKRYRPTTEATNLLTAPPDIPPPTPERRSGCSSCGGCHFTCHLTPSRLHKLYTRLCCCQKPPVSTGIEESIHELNDFPMTTMSTSTIRIESKDRPGRRTKPVCV